jgi:RNA polymerase sigma-70 factor (ECF subfamily)
MNADPVQILLEKLCSGDSAAAQEVFVTYEPYLRMVVRRLLPAKLRRKFDSVDVVHSIWADLLHGFRESGWRFADADHLRAFLEKATRNRFIDGVRKNQFALDHELSLENMSEEVLAVDDNRPSQIARAKNMFERLLELCPEQHKEVLVLKKQGFSLEEIASRTGFHPSSVRRILYESAQRMSRLQEPPNGNRQSAIGNRQWAFGNRPAIGFR